MQKSGRTIGLITFGIGTLALLFVFWTAYRMYTMPAAELFRMPDVPPESLTAAGLGSAAVLVLIRILLLFIMTLAASLIAGRGIQLYLGSEKVEKESPEQ